MDPPRVTAPPFDKFKPSEESWNTYIDRLKQYLSYFDIPANKQVSALLLHMGTDTYQMVESMVYPDKPESKTFDELVKLVLDHMNPEKSKYAARISFRKLFQASNETIQEFSSRLRKATISCGWDRPKLNENLLEQFVGGLQNDMIRQKILSDIDKHDFEKAVKEAIALQLTQSTSKELKICQPPQSVHKVLPNPKFQPPSVSSAPKNKAAKFCFRCGNKNHLANDCKFKNATCRGCGKIGHLQNVCRNGKKHPELPTLSLRANSCKMEPISIQVVIEDKAKAVMEIDTGSAVATMPVVRFNKVFKDHPREKTDIQIKTASNHIVIPNSLTHVKVSYNEQTCILPLYLMDDENFPILLGRSWLEKLRLPWSEMFPVSSTAAVKNSSNSNPEMEILKKFPDVCKSDIGCFTGEPQRLYCASDVRPVFLKFRTPPVALINAIEKELDKLVSNGVIEKVERSDWATPIVSIPKANGSVRICGDFKATVNRYLQVEQHPLPNIRNIFDKLKGNEFTVLDIRQAYLHIPINQNDRELLTISTHRGLYRFTRLPYGISSAPAIWQRTIESILGDLPNIGIFMDDIIISGKNRSEHEENVSLVLKRLQDSGFRINAEKSKFFQPSVEYCGFRLDANGIHKTDDKIASIRDAPIPANTTELKSFLGFIQYYSSFSSRLSELAHPLYELLKKGVKFHWSSECNDAYNLLKKEMTSDRILVPFDPSLPITLATDASPYGISAVLSHNFPDGTERPIAYYSRHLSTTEQRYSQLDKEALGIKEGVHKFFHYLYGHRFTLITDNKPLLSIFSPDKALPTLSASRMLRYAMFLAGFQYDIQYRNTKLHANADGLSRVPRNSEQLGELSTSLAIDDPISVFNINQINVLPLKAGEIARETANDVEFKSLREALVSPVKSKSDIKFFGLPIAEFSLENGCIMRGHRVVVPRSCRKAVLKDLHEGHFGSDKMKSLARNYIWWPGIDTEISSITKSCLPCIRFFKEPSKSIVHCWEPAKTPWSRVHIDFAQPSNSNYYLLIIVDAYSKFPEVFKVNNMTAKTTIRILDQLFARYGIPDVVVSDNGPQLVCSEFKSFLESYGVRHKTTPSYFPATNGQAERFVQTTKQSLLKSLEENADVETSLNRCLHKMRICTSDATGKSPSELFFGRQIKTSLDLLRPTVPCVLDFNLGDPKFHVGDKVAVRNYIHGPKWKVGIIHEVLGPLTYNVLVSERIIKRHEKQLRQLNQDVPVDTDTDFNVFMFLNPSNTESENSNSGILRRSTRQRTPVTRLNL